MKPFSRRDDWSLATKLNLLLLPVVAATVLSACALFVAHDMQRTRRAHQEHLVGLADTLAAQSVAALERGDMALAQSLLEAVDWHPGVVHAGLYTAQGDLVAAHRKQAPDPAPTLLHEPTVTRTDNGAILVSSRVVRDGQHLGTVALHCVEAGPWMLVLCHTQTVAIVVLVSLCGSVLLSRRLKRLLAEPVVQLTRVAHQISMERDFSIRAVKRSDDEIGSLCDEFNGVLDRIDEGKRELKKARDLLETRIEDRTARLLQANLKLSREIAERERAERELSQVHECLLEAAHRAGMAEIATDVLHNVGNVLNSVNISCALVNDRLRRSSVAEVRRLAQLVGDQEGRLGEFFRDDPRGRQVPEFLRLLTQQLEDEQGSMMKELEVLARNVDHIKTIVAMQQSYAVASNMTEPVKIDELMEDALRMIGPWLDQYRIEVIRQYAPLCDVWVQKQKLLQVLVNLVQNARDALVESGRDDLRLVVSIGPAADDRLRIDVTDNGVGLAPENQERIFRHGFTTKQTGHGFGLHSCANAAREMGGSLTVHSEGPGCGATFTLEVPFKPVEALV